VTGGIVIVAVYADVLRRRQQGSVRFGGGKQGVLRPPRPERGEQGGASTGGGA
jgi:hypothetical protein